MAMATSFRRTMAPNKGMDGGQGNDGMRFAEVMGKCGCFIFLMRTWGWKFTGGGTPTVATPN
jgi:hypothetical protein